MIGINDFITLVIHTPRYAERLKEILQSRGVVVKLEDFVSFKSPVTVAQRVKIRPKDLPLALNIIESSELYPKSQGRGKTAGMSGTLLIPVDFSELSRKSVTEGFRLAEWLHLNPILLHASTRNGSEVEMQRFKNKLRGWQKEGYVAPLAFDTETVPGVPEEAISEWCKRNRPELVFMTTRGHRRRNEEMVGSVTAEVLDSCRRPVFVISENSKLGKYEEIERLMILSTMDPQDIIALDVFMRMFGYPKSKITIAPVITKKGASGKEGSDISGLTEYFNSNYPNSQFEALMSAGIDISDIIDRTIEDKKIELLVVPNKKSNLFNRIFSPTLAHRTLFERDMPMMVIPV